MMDITRRMSDRLSGLSVARQIVLAFGTVLALMALSGFLAVTALERVDAQAETITEKWLTGVGHLADARAALIEARDFEVKHSRSSDRSYQAEYEDKYAAASRQAAQALASYEALLSGADERERFARFAKPWADYQKVARQVIGLGKDGKQQDAADISDGAATMAVRDAPAGGVAADASPGDGDDLLHDLIGERLRNLLANALRLRNGVAADADGGADMHLADGHDDG